MQNQLVVSVIVPVYNAEKTVRRCLDSILTQSYQYLEVLVVDDGSTDSSLATLREYEKHDPRVRVFTKENGGVSSARNVAIDQASGEYIQFVDSDDVLAVGATESMLQAMQSQDADLVIARYTEVAGNLRNQRGYLKDNMTIDQALFLDYLSAHPNSFYYAVLWNKLYRRDIIAQNDIRCDDKLPWGEDFAFNTVYFRYANQVAIISNVVYEYWRSTDGLALSTALACIKRPIYSIRVKFWLHGYYKQLYLNVGLYEKYRRVLPQYLFKVTISN